MASVNLQSKDGGDDGYTSPGRSLGSRSRWVKNVSDDGGELSPTVASVASPAASSSSVHDLIMNPSTDWYPTESASSPGGSEIGCQDERSDGGGGGGNEVKKPVWSTPSNDVVEVGINPVVDAVSWPALGDSTKSSSDGSLTTALQVPVNRSPSSQKPATVVEPQSNYTGNYHHYHQNSYRRGNGGPHPRAHGSNHHNHGGKPNQGRGWNQHRTFNNNRDTSTPPQRGGYRRGGYTRPPARNSSPFIPPPMPMPLPLPVGPFGNNVIYLDVASGMIYYPGPPIFPGPFCFPVAEPLYDKIMKQIDFYFSIDNLVKDTHLRRFMDEQGWVPVSLIASFNKVSCLTDNVQLILDVMQKSTVVEVQGDKMRRRNDWMRWLISPAVQDSLGSQLQGIRLDERAPVA